MALAADDVAEFFDEDMPGYAEASIGGSVVGGLFRNDYAEAFGVGGSAPAFRCASADVAAVAQGTAVTINAVAYSVVAIQPVAVGMTRLVLQES